MRRWFVQRALGRKIFTAIAVLWFCAWFARGFIEPIKEGANPHEELMRKTAEITAGADLVLTGWREGHWLFAQQPIVHFGFTKSTTQLAALWLRDHPQAFALVPSHELAQCFLPDKARKLGKTSRAEWFVVGADADNGQCHPAAPARVYRFVWEKPVL